MDYISKYVCMSVYTYVHVTDNLCLPLSIYVCLFVDTPTNEKMVCVSCKVATFSQLYIFMSAKRALLACISEGMVLMNRGNRFLSEREGEEAPYEICNVAQRN